MNQAHFPNLTTKNYRITSPTTRDYNCIAWAANDDQSWWWPVRDCGYYWPQSAPLEETLDAFVAMFEGFGYRVCETDALEEGYEKVAVYASLDAKPTHAARQLRSGKWTSKLGRHEDIEHDTTAGLEGDQYGAVHRVLKRPIEE